MKQQISPGVMTAIVVVAVVVIAAVGYTMFLKPKSASVGSDTKQKYMDMMKNGGSGGSNSGGTRPMGSGGTAPGSR